MPSRLAHFKSDFDIKPPKTRFASSNSLAALRSCTTLLCLHSAWSLAHSQPTPWALPNAQFTHLRDDKRYNDKRCTCITHSVQMRPPTFIPDTFCVPVLNVNTDYSFPSWHLAMETFRDWRLSYQMLSSERRLVRHLCESHTYFHVNNNKYESTARKYSQTNSRYRTIETIWSLNEGKFIG